MMRAAAGGSAAAERRNDTAFRKLIVIVEETLSGCRGAGNEVSVVGVRFYILNKASAELGGATNFVAS